MVGDIVQAASAILWSAQQRADDAAHNISNLVTTGYRARHRFVDVLGASSGAQPAERRESIVLSLVEGMLSETGNPHDIAISGNGFFELRDETGSWYTRNGQFTQAEDGRLLGMGGRAVQGVGGGDIMVMGSQWRVISDGSVMDADRVVARIAITDFDASDAEVGPDGLMSVEVASLRPVDSPVLRQGFLESSNVSLGEETIALMEALRRAETGQRLMNVYDDLMGRAITTFGQAS